MSVQATSWAWEHSRSTGSTFIVLLAMADAANREGAHSCQSVETLVRMSRVSEATVHRAIRWLLAEGEIEWTGNHRQYANVRIYRLPLVGGVNVTPLLSSNGIGRVSSDASRGVTGDTQPQEDNPRKTPATSRRSTAALTGEWIDGHEKRPPEQTINKFGTQARGLVKQLVRDYGSLGAVPGNDWQRAMHTARYLGANGWLNLVSSFYGDNGRPPVLPVDGNYQMYDDGSFATW